MYVGSGSLVEGRHSHSVELPENEMKWDQICTNFFFLGHLRQRLCVYVNIPLDAMYVKQFIFMWPTR